MHIDIPGSSGPVGHDTSSPGFSHPQSDNATQGNEDTIFVGEGERAKNDVLPKKICTGDSLVVNARIGKPSDTSLTIPQKAGQEITITLVSSTSEATGLAQAAVAFLRLRDAQVLLCSMKNSEFRV